MNRIKQLRTEKRMRQTELAKILKIGQATMSNWETGRSEPDYDALIEMSEIFGTSIDYILGNSDIKKAPSLEDAGLSAEEAVIENADFVRYIVIFRGSSFSFSYTFPTFIKILYDIFSAIIFYEAYFLHKHSIVTSISDSLTACNRLYSITHHIKNVNKNIDKPLSFAYYYVTVLLY